MLKKPKHPVIKNAILCLNIEQSDRKEHAEWYIDSGASTHICVYICARIQNILLKWTEHSPTENI